MLEKFLRKNSLNFSCQHLSNMSPQKRVMVFSFKTMILHILVHSTTLQNLKEIQNIRPDSLKLQFLKNE